MSDAQNKKIATKPSNAIDVVFGSRVAKALPSPREMQQRVPSLDALVAQQRQAIKDIILCKDNRMLFIVGPCSMHDVPAAREYADMLSELAQEVKSTICLAIRNYGEKPRTTTGWRGLLTDPWMGGTYDIENGLLMMRTVMSYSVKKGLPVATEWLNPLSVEYLGDFVSYGAIGARTAESQPHRILASGLSHAVGIKNGTQGGASGVKIATDALQAVRESHQELSIANGNYVVVETAGNSYAHIVLRGGDEGPNYHPHKLEAAQAKIEALGYLPVVVVDASHGNSGKDYTRQSEVVDTVLEQRVRGNNSIVGIFLESNLEEGSHNMHYDDRVKLKKAGHLLSKIPSGISITDSCIGMEETRSIILDAHKMLSKKTAQTAYSLL